MGPEMDCRGISSSSLEHLRDILILSLPKENIGSYRDHRKRDDLIKKVMCQSGSAGSRPSSAAREDREVRLRNLKERQNEERQKKLDEIKAQALAAQRYKEQKEHERKQRFEELRHREDARRQQVEERKRAINEAERDRLESILRRNQEREARIEARKRNDRSSMVFAFGSSTPRMLEPTDSYGSFWGHRRATSTQNITCTATPLTRRQSERELDGGSKKRATSAGGLERSCEGTPPSTPAGCVSGYVGRRRTDLMPTIPSKDPSQNNRKSFARSPGRAYSMSRLDQLSKPRKRSDLAPVSEISYPRPLNHSQPSSVSRSMSHLAVSKLGPQRPLRKSDSRSMHQLSAAAPMPPPRSTRATQLRHQKLGIAGNNNQNEAPSRPGSALSQQSTSSIISSVNMRTRPIAAPRRPRPASIAVTGVTSAADKMDKTTKPPLPKSRKSSLVKSQDKLKKKSITSPTESTPKSVLSPTTTSNPIVNSVVVEQPNYDINFSNASTKLLEEQPETNQMTPPQPDNTEDNKQSEIITTEPLIDIESESSHTPKDEPTTAVNKVEPAEIVEEVVTTGMTEEAIPNDAEQMKLINLQIDDGDANEIVDMTASMIKVRITTEEEAKAALAERRRLAREEAERLAEMERLRIEEENRLEMERQQREEEQQRVLIEQMRVAEQERLEEAIRETQRREEEEKARREEENRQKIIKEEADRKAREEAERQKAETQERLKHEEKEREARRKRVEAIMLRTRGKNTPPQTDEKNEEENSETLNGSKSENSENGHKNGKEIDTVDNIIPVETLKNANTVNVDSLSTDDTLNSNNSNNWQRNNQQTDLLM